MHIAQQQLSVRADSAMLNLCHRSLITLGRPATHKHQICQADARLGISQQQHYVDARTDCFHTEPHGLQFNWSANYGPALF
jgi:hypothetical protein